MLASARLIASMLFHVSARDPWIAAAVAALCAIPMLAAWIKALRQK